jgi:hypothetical protein
MGRSAHQMRFAVQKSLEGSVRHGLSDAAASGDTVRPRRPAGALPLDFIVRRQRGRAI